MFLGLALVYFILGQAIMAKYENFPYAQTHLLASVSKTKNTPPENLQKSTKVEKIRLGVSLDHNKQISQEKQTFSKTENQILLEAHVSNPLPNEEISCYFYYLGNDELSRPILVGSETTTFLAEKHQQENLIFKLHSPGNQWQLDGKFKAIISIPSAGIKQEETFSIL
jgi:hypothetical protein